MVLHGFGEFGSEIIFPASFNILGWGNLGRSMMENFVIPMKIVEKKINYSTDNFEIKAYF